MFPFQKTLDRLLAQHIGYPEWFHFTNHQTSTWAGNQTSTHTWTGNSLTISLNAENQLQNWNTTTITGNITWTITTP